MSPTITSRPLTIADVPAISRLHARVFGPGRFARSAYRVREGRGLVSPFCRAVFCGCEMIAALRLSPVTIGGAGNALLLGPLAVAPEFANQGHGRRLVAEVIEAARTAGINLIILVGDEPYYGRFGFARVPAGQIRFPGPVNPDRILAAELTAGALAAHRGLIAAAR